MWCAPAVTRSSQDSQYFTLRIQPQRCPNFSRQPSRPMMAGVDRRLPPPPHPGAAIAILVKSGKFRQGQTMYPRILNQLIVVAALAGLLSSCGIRRHKYADPITKNTEQP